MSEFNSLENLRRLAETQNFAKAILGCQQRRNVTPWATYKRLNSPLTGFFGLWRREAQAHWLSIRQRREKVFGTSIPMVGRMRTRLSEPKAKAFQITLVEL